jgi:hypothetical protein
MALALTEGMGSTVTVMVKEGLIQPPVEEVAVTKY